MNRNTSRSRSGTLSTTVDISKTLEFDAGHRVPNHKSKCRNPHGHRYKVEVYCRGTIIEEKGASDEGMLVDFSDLKAIMNERVCDVLDHGFIVYKHDELMRRALAIGNEFEEPWNVIIFPYIPTAENLARWIWEQLFSPILERFGTHLHLAAVKIWETPSSVALYKGGK